MSNAGFEGSIGTWAAAANCAVADTAVQAHTGADSMSLTSTAAGNMSAAHCPAGSFATEMLAVTPGAQVFAAAWFRSAVSARSCQVGAAFYDAAGNALAVIYGAAVTDSASAWTQATDNELIVAPAYAAWARAIVQVLSAGAASEVHYADDVVLATQGAAFYAVTSTGSPGSGINQISFSPAVTALQAGDVAVQVGPTPVLSAVTFWAGFGSNIYYLNWARLGGRVTFSLTLTDEQGNTLSMAKTVKCAGGNSATVPTWHKIRIPLRPVNNFNFSNVAGYTLTVTNRGSNDLRYTQLYLTQMYGVPASLPVQSPNGGVVYDIAGIVGSARAPVSLQCQQPGTQTVTRTINVSGGGLWLCPYGVTSVAVRCWGAGGAGGSIVLGSGHAGGGGGGGGTAYNAAVGVTAGNTYAYNVPAGGVAGGSNPGTCAFTGDSVTVTANSGTNGTPNAVTAGTGGAAGTGGYAGGAGGAGDPGSEGGGGGSSGGSAAAGNTGQAGSAGGAGGAAVTGGGAGGHAHITVAGVSIPGLGPGGGGGGGLDSGGGRIAGGSGANGQITLTYTAPKTFQSLLIHRPPVTAPDMLCPFVAVNTDDTPNGAIQYLVPSLIAGANARFAGTYTIVAVAWAWASPTLARNITITVYEYEQPGGAVYSSSVTAAVTPNTLPAVSGLNAGYGPFVVVGELTLPIQDLPQDNLNAYFTVSVTSGQTGDAFQDILFLDTMGSTVMIASPTAYPNYYLDEPGSDRDIGLIMGSQFDRPDAISILDRAMVTGGPLSIDPNASNSALLCYAGEGPPQVQMSYFPRWWLDRYQ